MHGLNMTSACELWFYQLLGDVNQISIRDNAFPDYR